MYLFTHESFSLQILLTHLQWYVSIQMWLSFFPNATHGKWDFHLIISIRDQYRNLTLCRIFRVRYSFAGNECQFDPVKLWLRICLRTNPIYRRELIHMSWKTVALSFILIEWKQMSWVLLNSFGAWEQTLFYSHPILFGIYSVNSLSRDSDQWWWRVW